MKTINLFFITLIATVLTSCTPSQYFQVYKAAPAGKIFLEDDFLVYEDENCKVSYNLWWESGNIGFIFYNKTYENIYLKLDKCFFINNGLSYDYFRNRTFTSNTSTAASATSGLGASRAVTGINYFDLLQTNKISATSTTGIITSSGFAVSYKEEKTICIPPMTSKSITEYNINHTLFRDCDLYLYPLVKQITSKTFARSNSPLVFSNIIVYTVGQSGTPVKFENEFYLSEITNYSENEMFESKHDEYCGEKAMYETKYFKHFAPDKFYIKYNKTQEGSWKL